MRMSYLLTTLAGAGVFTLGCAYPDRQPPRAMSHDGQAHCQAEALIRRPSVSG